MADVKDFLHCYRFDQSVGTCSLLYPFKQSARGVTAHDQQWPCSLVLQLNATWEMSSCTLLFMAVLNYQQH